jgi:protein-disulfide isomerase
MEEKWSVLRKKGRRKAEEKLVEAVSEKNAKIDDRYFRLVDKLMQRAEETIENTPVWSVNGLKEMATAMKYLKECKGVKSEADIREQEARIAKLQKEAQEEEARDTTVIVQFEEDITKWSK